MLFGQGHGTAAVVALGKYRQQRYEGLFVHASNYVDAPPYSRAAIREIRGLTTVRPGYEGVSMELVLHAAAWSRHSASTAYGEWTANGAS
jgi:hypothetical protein